MMRAAIALLLSAALGALAAAALLPRLFRAVPNDLSRVATVLDALQRKAPVPAIAVFGDSRVEAAVDARQLTRELSGHPLAWNLAWHSQRFATSFALHQEVQPAVTTVVYGVSLYDLGSAFRDENRMYEAMRAYGYTPNASTLAAFRSAFGAGQVPPPLEANRWRAVLASRWGLRHFADTGIRHLVRRDLAMERERTDLFFPNEYSRRVDERIFATFAQTTLIFEGPAVHPAKERLLAQLGGASQRIVLFLVPMHPLGMLRDHDRRVAELHAVARHYGIEVIDGSRWLEDASFVDPAHPSVAGAAIATSRLAAALDGR